MYESSGRVRSRITLRLGNSLATKIGLVVLWEVPHLILLVHSLLSVAAGLSGVRGTFHMHDLVSKLSLARRYKGMIWQ
jgi:hypothetical protein